MSFGLFYLNFLKGSISSRRGGWLILSAVHCMYNKIPVFNANSVDPDHMPDLGLHCLSVSLLWEARQKWVKLYKNCFEINLITVDSKT